MKNLFVLFFILLISCVGYAQKKYIEKNKTYSDAKIFQKGMSLVKVKNLMLSSDTLLQYTDFGNASKTVQLSTANIRYISVKSGTHALAYGAYGGGLGLLSALYGVLSVKNDPNLDDSETNWVPFFAGFTAGGFVIGAIVGAVSPRWKQLYIQDKRSAYLFKLSPNVNKDYCGLGLTINF